jgi:hypothetical protein
VPGGVFSCQGSSLLPVPFAAVPFVALAIVYF